MNNCCAVAKCEHLYRRNDYHIIEIKIFNIIILKVIPMFMDVGFEQFTIKWWADALFTIQ